MLLSIAIYITGAWISCFNIRSWEGRLNLDNLRTR